MHKYVYMYACSIYTAIIMDKWFMVAKVRLLSSHCKPKEFSWVSEKKMSLLQFLLQHCQTFLSAHATSLHGQDFFFDNMVHHKSKNQQSRLSHRANTVGCKMP